MDVRLDMSMMLAMHDALRRELVQVGRIAARRDDHPGRRLRAALGWELFKKFLTVHHQAEDDALWPPLRARVAGQPDQVALVDALEAEHAAIGPLLGAVDAAAADPDCGYQRFGDVIDELAGRLTAHLAHEETGGLPLIDASLTPAGWQHFAQVHTERVRGDAPVCLPGCWTARARGCSARSSAGSPAAAVGLPRAVGAKLRRPGRLARRRRAGRVGRPERPQWASPRKTGDQPYSGRCHHATDAGPDPPAPAGWLSTGWLSTGWLSTGPTGHTRTAR